MRFSRGRESFSWPFLHKILVYLVYFFKKYSKRGNLNNIQGLNNVQSPNAENFVQFEAKMTILWHFFYFLGPKEFSSFIRTLLDY